MFRNFVLGKLVIAIIVWPQQQGGGGGGGMSIAQNPGNPCAVCSVIHFTLCQNNSPYPGSNFWTGSGISGNPTGAYCSVGPLGLPPSTNLSITAYYAQTNCQRKFSTYADQVQSLSCSTVTVVNGSGTLYIPYDQHPGVTAVKFCANCAWNTWLSGPVESQQSSGNSLWGTLNLPSPGAYAVSISKGGKTLTLDVKALYVKFNNTNSLNVAWTQGGNCSLSDKLANNVYDVDKLNWTLVSSNGDSSAIFNTNTAVLYFGTNSGGSYAIRVESKDLTSCYDTKMVNIVKVGSVDVHSSDTNTYKIASNLGTHSNHFVCVKDTGDIILDAMLQPNVSEVADAVTWEADGATITSPAMGNDKTTAKLASSTAQKIPIRIKAGDNTCWSGTVWVVWAMVAVSNPIPVTTNVYQYSTRIKGGYSFLHTIQPASIIPSSETDDVPDLTGANNPAYPPPNVSESDTSVYQKDVNLTNGVNAKWDNSRQARQNIINPYSLPFPFDTNNPASLFTTYTNFPSDPVVGNDDIDIVSEDNNPYADPAKGKLTDYDCPAATPLHSVASVSNTFEIHFHTREFSRLQLGDKWYKISDYLLWKIHWKFKKASEAVDDQDYNEDGDKVDEVWIDNGSFIATDNNDF